MTRIFEALRKAHAIRSQAAPPPSEPIPASRTSLGRAMARSAEPVLSVVEPVRLPPLPEDFERELTHLRYALESELPGKTCRMIALACAQAREGATTVAASLARVLSQDAGQRVLLVDANARRPGVAAIFGLQAEASLREVLVGGVEFGRSLVTVERRNLRVLCAAPSREPGGVPFPLSELREFLAGVGSGYHWVILDVPPVLEAPEGPAIASLADGVVLVMRAGHVKRPVAARAAEVLRKAGGRVLGSVLNRRRLEIPEFIYRRV